MGHTGECQAPGETAGGTETEGDAGKSIENIKGGAMKWRLTWDDKAVETVALGGTALLDKLTADPRLLVKMEVVDDGQS